MRVLNPLKKIYFENKIWEAKKAKQAVVVISKIYHLIGEGMEFTGGIGFYIYYVRIKIKQKYSVKLNWNKI